MLGVPYAYGKESHLSINLITRTFKPKNLTRTKIGIEFLVLFISVFVMIAGGVMVTLNSCLLYTSSQWNPRCSASAWRAVPWAPMSSI